MGLGATKSSVQAKRKAPAKRRGPSASYADLLMADAEQEQQDDQQERRAEQPEQDQDHLRLLLYIRVVRSDAIAVRPKPVSRVR
jgi:hypothetical protein